LLTRGLKISRFSKRFLNLELTIISIVSRLKEIQQDNFVIII